MYRVRVKMAGIVTISFLLQFHGEFPWHSSQQILATTQRHLATMQCISLAESTFDRPIAPVFALRASREITQSCQHWYTHRHQLKRYHGFKPRLWM